jgi:hypothetical protein
MSSFSADGAMEAICFFKPWNGSVFPCAPVTEWLSSLPVVRRVICRFDASNPVGRFFNSRSRVQTKDDAGGRSASDGDPASGAGRSRWAIVAPGRPSRTVTTRRAVRVHRPDAFGTALLRATGAPRMRRSINDRHMLAMPSHARQRQNSSMRQSPSPMCVRSDFRQSVCAAGSTRNAT